MSDLYDICNNDYKELSNQNLTNPIRGGGGFNDRYSYDNLEDATRCDIMSNCTGITRITLVTIFQWSLTGGPYKSGKTKVCKIESTMEIL